MTSTVLTDKATTARHKSVSSAIQESWSTVAPFWPLKNLIAVNPLQGLEYLPFEEALAKGADLFQRNDLPEPMKEVNRQTIKWCQAFFDEGQATLPMPLRPIGFYKAWKALAPHDTTLHHGERMRINWLKSLSFSSEITIEECLDRLTIAPADRAAFLTLMLATLPGWAAHIKYRTEWSDGGFEAENPATKADYLAVRLAIVCMVWPTAKELLTWHRAGKGASTTSAAYEAICQAENAFRTPLLEELGRQARDMKAATSARPDAQLVFCIDVRSEPFRRALEAQGKYETLGFAGFFGVPIRIEDGISGDSFASCPVLLSPRHTVVEAPHGGRECCQKDHAGLQKLSRFKRFYQSLKYTFSTPFALVEALGPFAAIWMSIRNFAPATAKGLSGWFSEKVRPAQPIEADLSNISLQDQCGYAEGALRLMGLTRNFANLVVLCGHGSTTENNAFATALDCGACGGHHGAGNARVLAGILNTEAVRVYLASKGIEIPAGTLFLAGEHNTTTDALVLFDHAIADETVKTAIAALKTDLATARELNSAWRLSTLSSTALQVPSATRTNERSLDWAQVRPEWGLARNGAFIVGPRTLTKGIDLNGRAFLHSYDWEQDSEGASLTTILTAPMVVAQWINSQYLFSTLDNVAFGAGSKITKNITGKMGVMQGNASDLMHGLPLQSVFRNDNEAYHVAIRLMTVVYAPRQRLMDIVLEQPVLKRLFGNGWVALICLDPTDQSTYSLGTDLQWSRITPAEKSANEIEAEVPAAM